MGVVTREFTAIVEYDGEAFTLVLGWSTDRGFSMRPSRDDFSLPLDDLDLPPEIVRDLKQEYQADDGENESLEEGATA
jgi:hypothetical protein